MVVVQMQNVQVRAASVHLLVGHLLTLIQLWNRKTFPPDPKSSDKIDNISNIGNRPRLPSLGTWSLTGNISARRILT
jgi:hypothetical protein